MSLCYRTRPRAMRPADALTHHVCACLFAVAALLVSMTPGAPAVAQEWSESFESGLGGAKAYHKDAPSATLELVAEGAAAGRQFLRAVLPGERKLEGLALNAAGLEGGRVATVTARVRGKGEIWLCLYSANGWLYSPRTVALNDRWQEVSLSKVLMVRDRSLGIDFLSQTVQPGAVFEVDDVRVTLAAPLVVYDTAVEPCLLEAEDYASRISYIADDGSARGGKVTQHVTYMLVDNLPFPRTSRPVSVYVRARPGMVGDECRLITRQGGNPQVVARVMAERAGGWEWLGFPAVAAAEVGDGFDLAWWAEGPGDPPAAMDAVVISTTPGLEAEALDAAPGLFTVRPLARVGRCETPPRIDGEADDACWHHAVACTNFLVVRSVSPAKADTSVRLCYDDECLYLLFECEEPILNVRAQRTHEFAAKAEQRDGRVHGDNSCVILLDPTGTGREWYDFAVNALGTIGDARCVPPDYWESRDIAWDSRAEAQGAIDDSRWLVEVAIPFADLGVGSPNAGDVWRACLGRIARSRLENSSWNPSNRGFHDPTVLGALVFSGPVRGITLDTPPALQLGRNVLSAVIGPPLANSHGLYLTSAARSATGTTHAYTFAAPDEAAQIEHRFDVPEEVELLVAYGLLDAATLEPLYLSPTLKHAVRSSVAEMVVDCDGPFELYLNDDVLSRGARADNLKIAAPLQKGPNVFALQLSGGTAAATLAPPDGPAEPVRWKLGPAGDANATAMATDDGKWETAPKSGEHPELGPLLGTPGAACVLRHTLLWEKTRVWPTPDPALHIARNSAQHVTFIADGLPGRRLLDWTVYLAVPDEFEIMGATGYYNSVEDMPEFVCTDIGSREIGGRAMRVHKIVADQPIRPGRHYIMSLFNAFVRYREGLGDPEDTAAEFVYWTEANDGTMTEPPQIIPVRILPPLRGKQPQQLVWQLWGSFFGPMNKPELKEATLATAQAAGITDIVAGDRWTSDAADRYGLTATMGTNFQAWALNLQPYLAERPEDRLLTAEGEASDRLMCTTRLLGDSWQAVEELLKQKLEATRPDVVDYDYEYSPFTGPHSCYCPGCLAAFRERAKLALDVELSPEIIKERHDEEWIDFMAWQVALIFSRFKETIHRLSPGTHFSVYSGYQTPDNPRQYGVNWAYVGQLKACDHAGCGYGRSEKSIQATIEALDGIPAVFGALFTPYRTSETAPPNPFTKARLLRRALDATGGVLVYDRLPMDGMSWRAVAETTRLVAEHEPLFLEGKRTSVGALDPAIVQALTDGSTTLVCALNDASKPAEYTIALPGGAGEGAEFYSGENVAAGQEIRCSLPPGEAAVYVLRR